MSNAIKTITQLVDYVDENRLWEKHMEFAQFGAVEDNGVSRHALSEEDIRARRRLIDWAIDRGYEVKTDEIANLYFIRPGRCNETALIATGSHIDSQPRGGRFDGIFGVLAGLEVFQTLDEAGMETDHPIVVIAWTNEEGGRFAPGAMGSSVFAGSRSLSECMETKDEDGIFFKDALEKTLAMTHDIGKWDGSKPIKAYVEAHIEQGPILEERDLQVGIVTGIQGVRMFEIEISGAAAHAGTSPMNARSDALSSTVNIMSELKELMNDPEDRLRYTVGRLTVHPNSPNVVPDLVQFSIDLRHPDSQVLMEKGNRIEAVCSENLGRCSFTFREILNRKPCIFPENLVSEIEESADELSLKSCRMVSGAFHDALFMADVCPTAMIFVPSVGGISHNTAEYTKPEDLAAGTRLLANSLVRLADKNLSF